MKIEFIKWMVSRADGFEYQVKPGLRFPVIKTPDSEFWNAKTIKEFSTRWGILLQRAIEGVNRDTLANSEETGAIIFQNQSQIKVRIITMEDMIDKPFTFGFETTTPDQAKQAALMYVREQEETND